MLHNQDRMDEGEQEKMIGEGVEQNAAAFKAHGKFSKAHGKIEINFSVRFGKFSVRFESQISNHTSPQGDVCD